MCDISFDGEEELYFDEFMPVTNEGHGIGSSLGLDEEDIENLMDDMGAEGLVSYQELDEIRNLSEKARSGQLFKSNSSLEGSDLSELLTLDVDELLDDAIERKVSTSNFLRATHETLPTERSITPEQSPLQYSNSGSPTYSPPPTTQNPNVDNLIEFQANINKTLENLVQSMKRTEETRLLLAKESRRNSLDSPSLTVHLFPDKIPQMREEVKNEEFYRQKSALGFKAKNFSKSLKTSRRVSLTKPCRRGSMYATGRRMSMTTPGRRASLEKLHRRGSIGKSNRYKNRSALIR